MLMVIYMNKNDLWLLFTKTGKIEYEGNIEDEQKDRWNNNQYG